jgi:hypothetical protein
MIKNSIIFFAICSVSASFIFAKPSRVAPPKQQPRQQFFKQEQSPVTAPVMAQQSIVENDLAIDTVIEQNPMALCLGSINFPMPIQPDLSLYYKGDKLPLDNNAEKLVRRYYQRPEDLVSAGTKVVPYSLLEAKSTQKFHLIITSSIAPASELNTVLYWYIPQGVAYKFYTFSAARQIIHDEDFCSWSVTQEYLLQDNIIPDDTIIFLFDAQLVFGLEVKNWAQNSNVRMIPEIIIKPSATQNQIENAMIEARLAAIDVDAFHDHDFSCVKKLDDKAKKAVVTMMR